MGKYISKRGQKRIYICYLKSCAELISVLFQVSVILICHPEFISGSLKNRDAETSSA